ncbi:MAG: 50S ribosome-binding GTPase, partial [Gemmataceae bacterium]|nr:50S ribosome-binding GTPase [Gemmataceae bacterium]
MTGTTPTEVTCLTPPGRSAIAVLAVRGPEAWAVTRRLFRRGRRQEAAASPLPDNPSPGDFWLGWLGEATKGGADEVVVLVRQAAPEPWVEVHCHGGPEVVRLLQELYRDHGAAITAAEDFAKRHLPPWRAEAEKLLLHAPTTRTAAIALDQWHGAFEQAMTDLRRCWQQGRRDEVATRLRRLLDLVPVGEHLMQPWRVVLAGPPNVGKSSLNNALVGFARSLVAPLPGTTRDVVTTTIALDGWPIDLADTAGLRTAADPLESAGIARAWRAQQSADLVVWLLDGSAPPLPPPEGWQGLVVVNKTDLPAAWDWSERPAAVRVSAKTGAGVSELCRA